LPRPIIKSHPEEKWGWPWARGAPQNFGVPLLQQQGLVSDFKFGSQLGFARAHHKITRRINAGHGHGLGQLPKIWGFPFNIYTMAEASEFKFGAQIGFAKAHHKITSIGKVDMVLG